MDTIGVVGLGIVGGTVAGAFAKAGFEVRGYDRYLDIGSIEDLHDCDVVFVCVPTPSAPDGSHDLSAVMSVFTDVAPRLVPGSIIAIKSTVPPGTCSMLQATYPDVRVASIPEFLVASKTTETFMRPDRIVVGAPDAESSRRLTGLMGRVIQGAPFVLVDPTEAELIKLCSNAMLAAKVTLANELAQICGAFDVDWSVVQAGVGLDRRIGPDHLSVSAERGFGGECLPKDLAGLIAASSEAGYDAPILRALATYNQQIRRAGASDLITTPVS